MLRYKKYSRKRYVIMYVFLTKIFFSNFVIFKSSLQTMKLLKKDVRI